MDKLKMHTPNKADENFKKLAALFPNAVTEAVDENGAVVRAIDKDVLMQEINTTVVEGKDERYQFTWPDKKKSVLLANAPIAKTLRPCPAESVGKDGTPGGFDSENLYIEGDNLEVLKLLQETYLGKVKMIYIDPPYNTGNDFVYEDDFAQSTEEYLANSGQFDDEGNRLVTNTESNGRFHTDWLNMIYPRLKLAKDLLREDGVIFISIDDNEVCQLRKVCDEIFGESNFAGQFPWRKRTAKSDVPFGVSQDYEWILCYARSDEFVACVEGGTRKYYETDDFPGKPWRIHDLTTQRSALERPNSYFTIVNPKTGKEYPANPNRTWAVTKETIETYFAQNRIVFPGDYEFLNISKPALRYFKEDDMAKAGDKFGFIPASTNLPDIVGMTQDGTKEIVSLFNGKIFGFPKPVELIKHFLKISTTASSNKEDIILDFFSGSATTAHAVIAQNFQDVYDGKLKKRKFIMIQLPELCDEKSEAYKAGYKNICEIGKERIRRAGKHEYLDVCATAGSSFRWDMEKRQTDKNYPCPENVDIGFRVLKCDSTNMENVYYNPDEYRPDMFEMLADNIKADRTPEDLLFQVMLDLGVLLSSEIEETELGGKRVFNVADNFLIACFDTNVTEETITAIAKQKPYYFVMRDSSLANDSVAINFDQIFATYSPDTVRKVL